MSARVWYLTISVFFTVLSFYHICVVLTFITTCSSVVTQSYMRSVKDKSCCWVVMDNYLHTPQGKNLRYININKQISVQWYVRIIFNIILYKESSQKLLGFLQLLNNFKYFKRNFVQHNIYKVIWVLFLWKHVSCVSGFETEVTLWKINWSIIVKP
jgi:hypothetical protein